jgi:hypothetical protein
LSAGNGELAGAAIAAVPEDNIRVGLDRVGRIWAGS